MKIAFLGDIALIGQYDITENPNVKKKLKTLSKKLSHYDYVVGNLESPLTSESKTMICKSMHLKTPLINVELLKYLNINAVSLANNHLYDYGKKGFEETIKTLDKNGIEWFGANSKKLLKDFNGNKVSFSGFNCYSTNGSGYNENNNDEGINLLSYDNVIEQVDNDIKNDACSILSFHWGDEHTNYPNFEHIELVKKLCEKKDLIVVGHHPHVIQGIQKINNSIVAYSLGNFLFDDCVSINGNLKLKRNDENKKSFIFEIELQDGLIKSNKCIGFKDMENDFVFFDIDKEIEKISKKILNIKNPESYEKERQEQIKKVRLEKFGEKDFKWLRSRLNYYSIGAFVLAKFRKRKYLNEKKKFLGEKT